MHNVPSPLRIARELLAFDREDPSSRDRDAFYMQGRINALNDVVRALEHAERQRERPHVVCLCGSTRFWRTYQDVSLQRTLAGQIVLSIGAATGTDDDHFGNMHPDDYAAVKTMLDELHLRKIDMADEVHILNVDGYVGESTAREARYAYRAGKVVTWREPIGREQEAEYRDDPHV